MSHLLLNSSACYTCYNPLRQEYIEEKRRHKYDNNRCKHPRPVPRISHGADHRVQPHRYRPDILTRSEYQGHKILVPYVDEIEYTHRNDARLNERKHDLPECFLGSTAINSRRFFERTGQICEEAEQKNHRVGNVDTHVQEYHQKPH